MSGVNDGAFRCWRAHDRDQHKQCVLESIERLAAIDHVARVVGVHEDVGAGLQFVPDVGGGFQFEGAGAGAGYRRTGEAAPLQFRQSLTHVLACGFDGGDAFLRCAEMLCGAVIGLKPPERQMLLSGNRGGEVRSRLAWCRAATPVAAVDLDQHLQAHARAGGGGIELVDVLGVVGADSDLGFTRQPSQLVLLAAPDDLVGDQDVGDATAHHHFGFGHLLATDADRAERHLLQRDQGRLVRLAVRAQTHRIGAGFLGHALQVALERIEIEDKSRRVDFGEGHAGSGGGRHGHEARSLSLVGRGIDGVSPSSA